MQQRRMRNRGATLKREGAIESVNGRGKHATEALPSVSVVVATYNRPELLRQLLEQLSAQTLPRGSF